MILNVDHHVVPLAPGADPQRLRSFHRRRHRLDGVAHQVDDHLLDLHRVGPDPRHVLAELGLERHPAALNLVCHQAAHLQDQLVDVEIDLCRRRVLEQRADAADDLRGGVAVADDALRGADRFLDIGRRGVEPSQAGMAVRHDCLQRLVDFMRDGGGQLGHRRDPGSLRKLFPGVAQRVLRPRALYELRDLGADSGHHLQESAIGVADLAAE